MRRTAWVSSLLFLLVACGRPASIGSADETPARFAASSPDADGGVVVETPPAPPDPVTLRADVPPVAGGTLLLTRSRIVVAGDELTDELYFYDLDAGAFVGTIALATGDMPGRMAEDDAGHVHVVLRNAGAVLHVDPEQARALGRTDVCPAPRGLAFEDARGLLHVACAGGELVSLPVDGGAPVRALELEPDLRDVVVNDGRLFVSTFRSATLLVLDEEGTVLARARPPERRFELEPPPVMQPHVARRLVRSGLGVAMFHHHLLSTPVDDLPAGPASGTYGIAPGNDRPRAIVEAAVTRFDRDGAVIETRPIDGGNGSHLVVDGFVSLAGEYAAFADRYEAGIGRAVAVAVGFDGTVITQRQHPDVLLVTLDTGRRRVLVPRPVPFVAPIEAHSLFHDRGASGIACASCHPEGHEDGHVWIAPGSPARRTQSLLAGLRGTAPFHWNGDITDFDALMGTQARRLGSTFDDADRTAMLDWLDRLPAPPGRPSAAAERGRAAFESEGCASCHGGELRSDGGSHDVGAGGVQTPRLAAVALRAPWFHDGCAATLSGTLDGTCRPIAMHGVTSSDARDDIVAFLESL